MEKQIQDILKTIDDAITKFQGGIPAIQQLMNDELQPVLKEFQLSNGRLLNNLHNLKLLGTLKNKLQKIIINPKYKAAVSEFVDSFGVVSNLQMDYFKQFNKKFKPVNTLPIIKELAVETTINDLVGQGMNALVVGSVDEILRQNITTGGSYINLQKELEDHILDNYKGQGSLQKYTRQITTDAINQYNAQYHEAIAQDLQFNWGRYVGSLITTSREFCIHMTKLDYFHKSQLPEIVKGNIDGHHCKLSKTTGLPYGMIPGTNPENFKVRRGGYLCGHQVYWVPDSAVPEATRNKFLNKPAPAAVPPPPVPAPPKENTIAERVLSSQKPMLDEFKKKGYQIDDDLFDKLDEEISFAKSRKHKAWYHPIDKQIAIGALGDRMDSEYFKKTLFPHEMGHAIHSTKGIINTAIGRVSDEFSTHFSELQGLVKGKEKDIHDTIFAKRRAGISRDQGEQLCVIADILGSLTRGAYGYGHEKRYYRMTAKPEAEVFAHGVSLMKVSNDFSNITPEMQEVIVKMINYSKGL